MKPANEQEALNCIDAAFMAGLTMGGFNRDVNLEEIFAAIFQAQRTEDPKNLVGKITTRLRIFDDFRSKFPEKLPLNLP